MLHPPDPILGGRPPRAQPLNPSPYICLPSSQFLTTHARFPSSFVTSAASASDSSSSSALLPAPARIATAKLLFWDRQPALLGASAPLTNQNPSPLVPRPGLCLLQVVLGGPCLQQSSKDRNEPHQNHQPGIICTSHIQPSHLRATCFLSTCLLACLKQPAARRTRPGLLQHYTPKPAQSLHPLLCTTEPSSQRQFSVIRSRQKHLPYSPRFVLAHHYSPFCGYIRHLNTLHHY